MLSKRIMDTEVNDDSQPTDSFQAKGKNSFSLKRYIDYNNLLTFNYRI